MPHSIPSHFSTHLWHGLIDEIIEHTSAVIYVKDLDFKYLLVNRQFEQLFEVSCESIIGLSDFDIFPDELANVFRQNDGYVARTGESIKREEIAPHSDGPHTYLSVKFPLRDDSGNVFAVAGISTDITEWRETQREIESLHSRYELILESIGDGVCGLDGDGRVTFLNPAGGRLLGYTSDELKGKCRKLFVVERRRSQQACPVESVLRGGSARRVAEAVFQRKDGSHIPVEYVATPKHEGGCTVGAVIAFRDVSDRLERVRTEQELMAARAVQQALYPKTDPNLKGFEICGVTHPASLTSGDYYDYIQTPDGGLVIVVGDVSGHGLGPALEQSCTTKQISAKLSDD
jgi:PAS domain S-box-containing protein